MWFRYSIKLNSHTHTRTLNSSVVASRTFVRCCYCFLSLFFICSLFVYSCWWCSLSFPESTHAHTNTKEVEKGSSSRARNSEWVYDMKPDKPFLFSMICICKCTTHWIHFCCLIVLLFVSDSLSSFLLLLLKQYLLQYLQNNW